MKSSFDHEVIASLKLANDQLIRRKAGSVTFRSVDSALNWFFEMRTKLDGPQSMTPKTHTALDGSECTISVDGGRGGDMHEVFATMLTIDQGLVSLRTSMPRAFAILVMRLRDNTSWDDLEKLTGLGRATISKELGNAESYLMGRWKDVDGAVLR